MKGQSDKFQRLVEIMATLRSEKGCPWDREQTMKSLRKYVLEEAYEVVSAINRGEMEELKEELGDLLLQVVFLSRLAEEEGIFNVYDVIDEICEKLIRRHPHVFGDESARTPEEVLARWKVIKAGEGKKGNDEKVFPALIRAVKVGKKAAEVGYDWASPEDIMEKVKEEIEEVEKAVKEKNKLEEEIGDLLFAVANLARKADIDPEVALTSAVEKFERRFERAVELIKKSGKDPSELSIEELDQVWEKVKGEI